WPLRRGVCRISRTEPERSIDRQEATQGLVMRLPISFRPLALAAAISTLFAGCVTRTRTVTGRNFILAPISTNEPAKTVPGHLTIGIGFVKMPPYLLRNSLAVRDGSNEIQYIEAASWAERLDQCFQRTLSLNLSRLLPADAI